MRKTRWGILGTGSIAALFAEALSGLEAAELTAVGSRTPDNANRFAQLYGAKRAYGSYEALVDDPEIDVVYVATPNSLHMAHCILALEHGKPVLCEKPFTVSASEARTVIETARRVGLFCMEGMWMRFAPLVREVVRRVHDGALGDLRLVEASLGLPVAFDPAHRVFDPALGGGALLDLGVYPLSLAFHLLGRPTAISSHATLGKTGVDEETAVLLQFPEGRQASITTSLRCRLANAATVTGTHGILRIREPIYCPESATLVRTRQPVSSARGPMRRLRLAAVRYHPLLRELRDRVVRARDERTFTLRRTGNGYAHEALEVMRCLAAGEKESSLMPLDETLSIMEALDACRAQWSAQRELIQQGDAQCGLPS